MQMRAFAPIAMALALVSCGSEPEEAATPGPTSAVEAPPEVPVMGTEVPILAIGDSLFTGYKLEDGESYPAMLEAALRARGINARIANAGVSGDTSSAGRQRLAFALDNQPQPPQLALISLGGNDLLRGLPPRTTRENLDAMMAELDKRGIDVVLLGMLAPPNLGPAYSRDFNSVYPALAEKYDATLVPFFMQPLLENPDLVQADRIHPTAQGVEAMVRTTVDSVAQAIGKRGPPGG